MVRAPAVRIRVLDAAVRIGRELGFVVSRISTARQTHYIHAYPLSDARSSDHPRDPSAGELQVSGPRVLLPLLVKGYNTVDNVVLIFSIKYY